MRSSTGEHYVALDHLRGLAAFLVFSWHFMHTDGKLVPLEYAPVFPGMAFIDEGHMGVSLFMALSGYLFAKLLHGKSIAFGAFFRARFWRLAPLLLLVMAIVGAKVALTGEDIQTYLMALVTGFVLPRWPNGGWSIAVEIHFYLALPLLLWLSARSKSWLLAILAASLTLRLTLFLATGEIKTAAYSTIIGRIDQFVMGMLLFHYRSLMVGKHLRAAAAIAAFSALAYAFDVAGGDHAAPQSFYVIWPLIEGLGFALVIAWYDGFKFQSKGVSRFLGLIGTYSYSIYLLHFFVVYHLSRFINRHVMDITHFYPALAWSVICFLLMVPVGYLSFRFIESPFLRTRVRYLKDPRPGAVAGSVATT